MPEYLKWFVGIFTYQYTILKMTVVLHKTALINFPMATTVLYQINFAYFSNINIAKNTMVKDLILINLITRMSEQGG